MNFQMFKLDLEKAEEPEIKLPTSVGSLKKQESFGERSTSSLLTMLKTLTIVNETEVDVLLEFHCFFNDPTDVGNLISGSSAFSKFSLNIWKFLVHVFLKPSLENFKHYFASM